MFGSRTTLADPLDEHVDDWSARPAGGLPASARGREAEYRVGLVSALLDAVPVTSRNLASLIEYLVDEHARRVRSEGRARHVIDGPVPDGAFPASATSWSCAG